MKKLKQLIYTLICAAVMIYTWLTQQNNPQESVSVQMTELNSTLQDRSCSDTYSSTYEVFVHAFCDTNQDGTGDLNGVTKKLDYIYDLGFRAVWLMPIAESPSSHKYDVTDYCSVDDQYGTLEDFDHLVQEASARDMKIITDLVINHTSDQHPWFQSAAEYLRSIGTAEPDVSVCPYVDYYHFSREPHDGYEKLWNSEWYYEARFIGSMPDLNLDSTSVRNELKKIMEFWIDHGVSGFRLDAVTSYYTGDDYRNTEFMRWLADTGRGMKSDLYFVGEAWTARDTYASYYASGMDSYFDFSFANENGVIAETVRGSRGADDYVRECIAAENLYASYNSNAVNAPFYTNHDVNRSLSYYPDGDAAKVKMAQGLNLLMKGNAFLYYGEELGMAGSGKDENKRAPMYWSTDSSCEDLCAPIEWMEDVSMKFGTYEEQKDDPSSVYCYIKEAMKIRNAFPVIACGSTYIEESLSDHDTAVFFKAAEGQQDVMIVINTSWQRKEVDLTSIGDLYLAAVLNTNNEYVCFDDGHLTIPAYTIAVFAEK